jgi:hypothetical protein
VPSQPGSCRHSLGSALLVLVMVLWKLTMAMMFTTLYSLIILIMLDISHAVDASEILFLYTLLRVFRSTTSSLWRHRKGIAWLLRPGILLAILCHVPLVDAVNTGAAASAAVSGGLAALAAAVGIQPAAGAAAAGAAAAAFTASIVIPDYVSPVTRTGGAKFARSGGNLRWTTLAGPDDCGM